MTPLRVEPSTYIPNLKVLANGLPNIDHFWLDSCVYEPNLRVEHTTYIPNLKVLAQRVSEICTTSGLTAAILDFGNEGSSCKQRSKTTPNVFGISNLFNRRFGRKPPFLKVANLS